MSAPVVALPAPPGSLANPKLLYSRTDAADALAISPTSLDRLVRAGDINPVRLGSVTKYTLTELVRFVESLPLAS